MFVCRLVLCILFVFAALSIHNLPNIQSNQRIAFESLRSMQWTYEIHFDFFSSIRRILLKILSGGMQPQWNVYKQNTTHSIGFEYRKCQDCVFDVEMSKIAANPNSAFTHTLIVYSTISFRPKSNENNFWMFFLMNKRKSDWVKTLLRKGTDECFSSRWSFSLNLQRTCNWNTFQMKIRTGRFRQASHGMLILTRYAYERCAYSVNTPQIRPTPYTRMSLTTNIDLTGSISGLYQF